MRASTPETEEGGPARDPAAPAEARGGSRLGPGAGARLLGAAPGAVLRFEAARRAYLDARQELNEFVLTQAEQGLPVARVVDAQQAARYRALRRRATLHVGDDGRVTLLVALRPTDGPAADAHEAVALERLDRWVDRLVARDRAAWDDGRQAEARGQADGVPT